VLPLSTVVQAARGISKTGAVGDVRVFANIIGSIALEQDNVLFPHTWVLKVGLPQLEEHVASLQKYPPIPPGTSDPYTPPN